MEYNEAEAVLRVAEEEFKDHQMAILSEMISRPANPDALPDDPDEDIEMERVREYCLEIHMPGNALIGPELFTEDIVKKCKRVIKKSGVAECVWSLRDGHVLSFENI